MSTHAHRPTPRPPHRASDDELRAAAKRVAGLGALALVVFVAIAPFAGIVLFVAGLAALAAHAAAHPHEPS